MKCTKCGYEINSGDKFCEKCGSKINSFTADGNTKFCTKCGAVINKDSRFCSVCGYVMDDVPQKRYLFFIAWGYLSSFSVLFLEITLICLLVSVPTGFYLMARPETRKNKRLYIHGILMVVMSSVFFIIRLYFP